MRSVINTTTKTNTSPTTGDFDQNKKKASIEKTMIPQTPAMDKCR